jgi:nicotinic acid phosphoribosyltransferase
VEARVKSTDPQPLLTDLYELTMAQAYFREGLQGEAVFELFVRTLPPSRRFLIAAGLEQALEYLESFRFTDSDIEALRRLGTFSAEFLAARTRRRGRALRRTSSVSGRIWRHGDGRGGPPIRDSALRDDGALVYRGA